LDLRQFLVVRHPGGNVARLRLLAAHDLVILVPRTRRSRTSSRKRDRELRVQKGH
jgi:hypothetical protein